MSCPICDNSPSNCDCSSDAIRLHEEVEALKSDQVQMLAMIEDRTAKLNVANLQNEALRMHVRDLLDPKRGDVDAARAYLMHIEKPLCEHKTVPTFDGLGVRLKCQLCGEYISE